MAKCIYCGRFFNAEVGEGDHVLPCGLFGEFEGDVRFRGSCVKCNNALGINEQLLAQGTPFGFFRWIVKPNLGRRKNRAGLRQRGANGAKRPRFTMKFGERTILVHPSSENPLDATGVDHLMFRNDQGDDCFVRLFTGMTVERLKSDVAKSGGGSVKEISLDCEASRTPAFLDLLRQAFPTWKLEERAATECGNYTLPGRAEFEFSVGYFQAIAKIALHYYLCRSQRRLTGNERAFARIRQFIKNGGDKNEFFHSSGKTFLLPFGETATGQFASPRDWCHILAADESSRDIVVFLQFFAGPGCAPSPDYVTLGETSSRVVLPHAVWGHVFTYEQGRKGRYAGTTTAADLTRLKRVGSGR